MIFNRNMDKSQDNIHTEQEPKMSNFYLIHPILFAIYPIIFLYSYNVQETSITQLFTPILVSVITTIIIWVLVTLFLKDSLKASFITTIFVLMFFSYGRLIDSLEGWGFYYAQHRYVFPSLMVFGFYLSYFVYIVNNRKKMMVFSKIISIIVISLIVINVINIVPNEIKKSKIKNHDNQVVRTSSSGQTANYPDIYYIILDEYASLDTIKKIYNYDNSEFANNLIGKGFYIADKSKTRYTVTEQSIAASLNMGYLVTKDKTSIYQMISNNRVKNYLKKRGYKYVYIGNEHEISRWNPNADIYYNYYLTGDVSYIDEFSSVLINSTMLKPFEFLFEKEYSNTEPHRNSVLFALEYLKRTPKLDGPKFVFAHILSPHVPFCFNKNGDSVDPINQYNWNDKQYYLNQYIYITKEIELLVDKLLKDTNKLAVIIIQSDHGPRGVKDFSEKEKIFNAYFLPNNGRQLLSNNISPVNSFRLIFNHYFNDNLPLLEN